MLILPFFIGNLITPLLDLYFFIGLVEAISKSAHGGYVSFHGTTASYGGC